MEFFQWFCDIHVFVCRCWFGLDNWCSKRDHLNRFWVKWFGREMVPLTVCSSWSTVRISDFRPHKCDGKLGENGKSKREISHEFSKARQVKIIHMYLNIMYSIRMKWHVAVPRHRVLGLSFLELIDFKRYSLLSLHFADEGSAFSLSL